MPDLRRVVLLTLGWEELPTSVSVPGASSDVMLREPVPGVLLETDAGWLRDRDRRHRRLEAGPYEGSPELVVERDESVGGFVFAFDHGRPPGEPRARARRRRVRPEETVEPIRRLRQIASDQGCRLVPGHEQVGPGLTEELATRFGG